jgi:hypothetical protein
MYPDNITTAQDGGKVVSLTHTGIYSDKKRKKEYERMW